MGEGISEGWLGSQVAAEEVRRETQNKCTADEKVGRLRARDMKNIPISIMCEWSYVVCASVICHVDVR